ncbi:MAG: hypothetical protein ACLFRI_05995 [Candidatus Izemoplasmataceae bacterium]
MINQYKEFFLSQDLISVTPYALSIIEDDVEGFVQAFEPFKDEDILIDPIEIAAAYNSSKVFDYLIHEYDYSEYYNPFRLTLPVILVIFERDHMLFDALEHIPFSDELWLGLYEFMLQTKEGDYFIQYYKAYQLDKSLYLDLLISSLDNPIAFTYLLKQKGYKKFLKHEALMYEIICYHQSYLDKIAHVEDLSLYFDIEDFIPILRLDDQESFKEALQFIVTRNIDLNKMNEFGLTFFHEALRHAVNPNYVFYLFDKGANPFFKTSKGYASSHQLLFRDSEFTLELSRIVDFDAQDLLGLTLKDYDHLQRKDQLQLLDVLLVVKCVLNMDESAIYELDYAEFYDLSSIHGVDPFMNTYSLLLFENTLFKQHFKDKFATQLELEEPDELIDSLKEQFIYDSKSTLEIMNDLLLLEEADYDKISAFAKDYQTTIKITTDDIELNKTAHVEITFDKDGSIKKHATIYSNYIDVYYIHRYFNVPLDHIVYSPNVSKHQRFLN